MQLSCPEDCFCDTSCPQFRSLRCSGESHCESEAICVLDIGGLGTIRFVDLAGSERNYETRYMTAQQHRDFAEINKSLMALKAWMTSFTTVSLSNKELARLQLSQNTVVCCVVGLLVEENQNVTSRLTGCVATYRARFN